VDRLDDIRGWAVGHVGLIALAAVAVAFLGSVVHLQRFDEVRQTRSAAPGTATEDADGVEGAGGARNEVPGEVGPRIGHELQPYLAVRAAALDDHDDAETIRAVVSFSRYLTVDEVDVPDDLVVEAVQLRVPIVDVAPAQQRVEDGDLAAAVASAVAREREALEEEERDLRTTLGSDVGDLAFEADFERRLEELADLDELDEGGAVVFALVVTATAAELRAFAEHPDVRLVDPGGRQEATARTRFYGLLPDDTVRASHGRSL
jgi:hypothetical protein